MKKLFTFAGKLSKNLGLIPDGMGGFFAGWRFNDSIEVQKLNANSGYIVSGLNLSFTIPEPDFQLAIKDYLTLQFRGASTGDLLLPDSIKAVTYIRQATLEQPFSVSVEQDLELVVGATLKQHAGLIIDEISVLISFWIYEINDQNWVAQNLRK